MRNREVWHVVTTVLEECISHASRVEYNRGHIFSEISSGAFAKLRKVIISFVMPVCLSVCPQGTIWLLMEVFI
jgi:hypothetical protein